MTVREHDQWLPPSNRLSGFDRYWKNEYPDIDLECSVCHQKVWAAGDPGHDFTVDDQYVCGQCMSKMTDEQPDVENP